MTTKLKVIIFSLISATYQLSCGLIISYMFIFLCSTMAESCSFLLIYLSTRMSVNKLNIHKLVQLTLVTCVSVEVVCLDRSLLLFHQLCKLQKLRGHQTDDEQLHVSMQHPVCVFLAHDN